MEPPARCGARWTRGTSPVPCLTDLRTRGCRRSTGVPTAMRTHEERGTAAGPGLALQRPDLAQPRHDPIRERCASRCEGVGEPMAVSEAATPNPAGNAMGTVTPRYPCRTTRRCVPMGEPSCTLLIIERTASSVVRSGSRKARAFLCCVGVVHDAPPRRGRARSLRTWSTRGRGVPKFTDRGDPTPRRRPGITVLSGVDRRTRPDTTSAAERRGRAGGVGPSPRCARIALIPIDIGAEHVYSYTRLPLTCLLRRGVMGLLERRSQPSRPPWFRLRIVAPIAVVLASAGTAGLVSVHQDAPRAAAASDGCGSGVPANKCNPVSVPGTSPGAPGTTVPKRDLPALPANAASLPAVPATIRCGANFFSQSELQALQARFGVSTCFRFAGSDQWIAFGNGTTPSSTSRPPRSAPGGSMVAVLNCSASASTCLTANAAHTFSSFTVYYPPNPRSRSTLIGYYGEGILQIANGGCSLFLFDVNTRSWYPGSGNAAESLAAEQPSTPAQSTVKAVSTPSAAAGKSALALPAPADTGDCPQY